MRLIGTALVALALIVSACGAPTGAPSTDSSRVATTTTTTLVDPTTTSSSSVASGGDQPDFSEPTAFRAADLEVGELIRLAVEDIEDPDVVSFGNPPRPTAGVIRERRSDEAAPTEAELLEAIPLLEGALTDQGFEGRVTILPQAGPSFSGIAPAFSEWLDDDFFRVSVAAQFVPPPGKGTPG